MPESDSFFKYLLTLGLAENHQLYKLIVVDKIADAYNVINSFGLGGGDVEQDARKTQETIETIPPDACAYLCKKAASFLREGL